MRFPMARHPLLASLACLSILAGGWAPAAPARRGPAQDQAPQQILKAAFICHFLSLTQWPERKDTLLLGIYGHNPQGDELARVMPKKVGAIGLRVVRIDADSGQLESLDALYIPATNQDEVPGILKRLGQLPILTIGDGPRFTQEGGLIGLVVVEGKLRFDINQGMAKKKGLQFRAMLRDLARETLD